MTDNFEQLCDKYIGPLVTPLGFTKTRVEKVDTQLLWLAHSPDGHEIRVEFDQHDTSLSILIKFDSEEVDLADLAYLTTGNEQFLNFSPKQLSPIDLLKKYGLAIAVSDSQLRKKNEHILKYASDWGKRVEKGLAHRNFDSFEEAYEFTKKIAHQVYKEYQESLKES